MCREPSSMIGCGSMQRMNRRRMLGATAAAAGVSGWTMVAERLARAAERDPASKPAKSIIIIWLSGGPVN